MVFVWFQHTNQKLNPSFLFNLHQGLVANEHQYVTKWHYVLQWEVRGLISLQYLNN
jgi:hypothetical protein